MKLNENFVLKTVAGSTVVMPVGEAVSKINGMIKLNDSAKLIWELLEAGKSTEEILAEMKNNFSDADEEILTADLNNFLNILIEKGILEE